MTEALAGGAVAASDRDSAFAAYVAARQRSLLRTAVLLTGDPHAAEDLLQSALARLYLSWGSVRRADAMDAYVRRTMVNQLTSWWRRSWRRREVSVADVPDQRRATAGARGTADEVAERDALWQALQELPAGQRAVVVLRYYEDLSEAQTADLLGCSVGTVKSQASRALGRLRASIEEGGAR